MRRCPPSPRGRRPRRRPGRRCRRRRHARSRRVPTAPRGRRGGMPPPPRRGILRRCRPPRRRTPRLRPRPPLSPGGRRRGGSRAIATRTDNPPRFPPAPTIPSSMPPPPIRHRRAWPGTPCGMPRTDPRRRRSRRDAAAAASVSWRARTGPIPPDGIAIPPAADSTASALERDLRRRGRRRRISSVAYPGAGRAGIPGRIRRDRRGSRPPPRRPPRR
mmetsp:Transcript_4260/g.10859  ORF Transcript_4260/g.10859 Transcript_4260/m.10859 type:complete len:217 (-) Transcript_4260:75-725(-)